MEFLPLNFSKITCINSSYIPSTIKQRNNRAYCFWSRALYERAMSVLKFRLPDEWLGAQETLLRFVLARNGYGVVSYEQEFGHFFQPCSLSGFGFYYQPVNALVSNPAMKNSKTYTIGKDCELLKLTPDYLGIWDIIDYFAVMLSQINESLNVALVNSKNAWMLFGKSKGANFALKKAVDLINQGEPAVVFDSRIILKDDPSSNTATNEPIIKIDLGAKENAEIVSIALQDTKTILEMFDNEIGIPTAGGNQVKRERNTQYEAEVRKYDGKARCKVWLRELKSSIKRINKLYPDLILDVELDLDENDNDIVDKEVDENAND